MYPCLVSGLSLNALAGIHLLLTYCCLQALDATEVSLNALAGIHLLLTPPARAFQPLKVGLNALAGIHLLLTKYL